MKVMRIASELIQIICVHTEGALTAIRIECTFSQSTSIGGLKANYIITGINAGVIYSLGINCIRKRAMREEITSVTLLHHFGKVLYL